MKPPQQGVGRQGRQAGLRQSTTGLKLAGKYSPEAMLSPLMSGMRRVPGWVKGTPRPGEAQGCARNQPAQGGPDGFHPDFLQLTLMGGRGVNTGSRPLTAGCCGCPGIPQMEKQMQH